MITVLHLTPHLGGGVGRVLLNYLAHVRSYIEERHDIFSLEYANKASVERATNLGIRLEDRMAQRVAELLKAVAEADIVVIHWWNHPLLYSLLVNETLPPSRVVMWSHVSGHFPPQNFTDPLLFYPDRFVIATPYSFEAPTILHLASEERNLKVRLIFSCAGIGHVASVMPRPHEGFRIGYVGTVDYCKMHPNFICMSVAADIPDVRFVVCGGPNETAIREEVFRSGFGSRFDFLGHVSDVATIFSTFDVFGYPLASDHYGTGEQALIEALAAGVPPVVLGNGAERHIIEDGVTGIVVEDAVSYTHALESLHRQPEWRLLLAENARRIAREKFTIESLARAWSDLYDEMLQIPKRARCWASPPLGRKVTGAEVLLSALGEHGADYAESMHAESKRSIFDADERIIQKGGLFRAKTRGTVFHYQRFFPEDPYLNLWCGLMLQADGVHVQARYHFTIASRGVGFERVRRYLELNAPVPEPNGSALFPKELSTNL